MSSNSSHYSATESDEFGFPASRSLVELADDGPANSPEEVIGEMGLVLIVILGAIVAINVALTALHVV